MLKHFYFTACNIRLWYPHPLRRDDNGAALFPGVWRPDKGCLCLDDNESGQT